jgi:hypothetical protein
MISLTDEMVERIANALTDGCPVIAASVAADGQPKFAFYGSTHVHSSDALAIWVRDPASSVLGRIAGNPRMSFLYRNPTEKLRWVFEGRARVIDDPEQANAIFESIHPFEQATDPERKGRAVVIDLDKVTGRDLLMER